MPLFQERANIQGNVSTTGPFHSTDTRLLFFSNVGLSKNPSGHSFYFKHIPEGNTDLGQSRPTHTPTNNFSIFVNWLEFVLLMHKPIIPLDSKYVFLLDFHMTVTFHFPRKDQNLIERPASRVFRKQRKALCVNQFCHIKTPNAVCLSKQELWKGVRKPQH